MAEKLVAITHQSQKEAAHLEQELRRRIHGEVRFDAGSRALYATDGGNYRQVPIGIVIPRNIEDAVATMAVCREHGAPLLSRGGGTSLAGQCCNVAVVVDFSKYMRNVLRIDVPSQCARVQPGTVLDDLRNKAEEYHLTFAPDPSTHNHCTLGGMIGNNSCGTHSVMGGKTDDNVISLDILTYDGERMTVGRTEERALAAIIGEGGRRAEIYKRLRALRDKYANLIRQRYPKIPRRVSGYNLNYLLPENGFDVAKALVGSEGTCVMVLEAELRLVPSPPKRSLLVLGYPDVYSAGDHVMEVLEAKPIGLEGIDDKLVHFIQIKGSHAADLNLLPEGAGWLMVEFGGETKEEADEQAHKLITKLKLKLNPPSMKLYDNRQQEERLWHIRESGLGATAFLPGQPLTWEGWEDSAVSPERLGGYLRDLRKLFDEFHYGCALYGHFGQGCVHIRIDFDLMSAEGIRKYRSFIERASDLVLSYGGSLSGEHGDGQSRAEMLPKMFGPELVEAFREFKSVWDPQNKMNPHKVVEPYRIDENLRLGAEYDPWHPKTHFQFPEDHGDFSHAALRCVGVGECRRVQGKTMCPSYRVTLEEEHTTRGRAHMLFEMLHGNPIKAAWDNEPVKRSLDLCLACKGCKSDCPVNVDMATYKAEFLSHYYEHHPRPLYAYAFGYIDRLASMGAMAPWLANAVAQTPGLNNLLKWSAGLAQQRKIPRLASQTFKGWFQKRGARAQEREPVILWADTFNNYFFPHTAQAAVEVLEAAGFQVYVPEQNLCCGRPLYDFGMLDRAQRLLRQILETLRPLIASGVPLVALEPSCLAVFRDELKNLFANDDLAIQLSQQSYALSEFLEKHVEDYRPPQLARKAIVQGHCHQRAIVKMESEENLLKKMGLDFEILDSGCCGMAGSFGFEAEKYDVSVKVGELMLLPAVRKATPETLIIADGFSCREQIEQLTPRHALHLAEVMKIALRESRIPSVRPKAA